MSLFYSFRCWVTAIIFRIFWYKYCWQFLKIFEQICGLRNVKLLLEICNDMFRFIRNESANMTEFWIYGNRKINRKILKLVCLRGRKLRMLKINNSVSFRDMENSKLFDKIINKNLRWKRRNELRRCDRRKTKYEIYQYEL